MAAHARLKNEFTEDEIKRMSTMSRYGMTVRPRNGRYEFHVLDFIIMRLRCINRMNKRHATANCYMYVHYTNFSQPRLFSKAGKVQVYSKHNPVGAYKIANKFIKIEVNFSPIVIQLSAFYKHYLSRERGHILYFNVFGIADFFCVDHSTKREVG